MKRIIFALVASALLVLTACAASTTREHDEFAKCLTDSGATFYGAFWCPHCIRQKEMFGDSIDKVNYVECSLPDRSTQTPECMEAGIEAYPTWEFADGERVQGAMTLERLSSKTGCSLG